MTALFKIIFKSFKEYHFLVPYVNDKITHQIFGGKMGYCKELSYFRYVYVNFITVSKNCRFRNNRDHENLNIVEKLIHAHPYNNEWKIQGKWYGSWRSWSLINHNFNYAEKVRFCRLIEKKSTVQKWILEHCFVKLIVLKENENSLIKKIVKINLRNKKC